MMTILYPVNHGIYVNMTNRCPCACTFCLRQKAEGVYGSDSLWLEREPSVDEIIRCLSETDLSQYQELVFCGYGEPTERLDDLLEVAKYVRSVSQIPIRINTNGLSDLIWKKKTAHRLQNLIDTVSVSLNATNADDYLKTVRPKFGLVSFDAMLAFAKDCTKYVPNVIMSVVDVVTSPAEQELAREISERIGATLRIRPYEN